MNTVHDGGIFEAEIPSWMQSFVAGDKMILVFEQKGQRKQYFRWKLDEDTYAVILDDTHHTSLNLLLNSLLTAMGEGFKVPEIILPDPSLPDINLLREKIAELTETLEGERAKFTADAEEASKRCAADLEAKINQYVEEFEAKARLQASEFEEAMANKTKEFEAKARLQASEFGEAMANKTKEAEESIASLTKQLEEERKKADELSVAESSVRQALSELEKTVEDLREQNTDQAARLKDTLAKNLELTHQINELTAAAQKGITISSDNTKFKEENIRLTAQIQDWEQRFKELSSKYAVLQKQAETLKAEAAQKTDLMRRPRVEPKPQPPQVQSPAAVAEENIVEVSQTERDKKSTEIHIHINQPAAQQTEEKPEKNEKSHFGKKQDNEISHPSTVKSSPTQQHIQAAMENRALVDVVQALTSIISSGDASRIDLAKLGQFVSVPSKADLERNPAAVKTVIAKLLGMERSGQLNPEQIAKLKEVVL
jgi:hypothetical protein